jgi:hypothetical protein
VALEPYNNVCHLKPQSFGVNKRRIHRYETKEDVAIDIDTKEEQEKTTTETHVWYTP